MIVMTNQRPLHWHWYLAMMMPRLAEQTQAASMKAPCRKMNSRDLDSRLPTSPRPRSEAAITFLSWKFMLPVSESTRPCSQSEVSIVRVLTNHSPVLPGRASRGSGPCPGPSSCPLQIYSPSINVFRSEQKYVSRLTKLFPVHKNFPFPNWKQSKVT